jgi:hypothetical protein
MQDSSNDAGAPKGVTATPVSSRVADMLLLLNRSTTATTANTTANTSSSNEQTAVTLQIPSVTLTVISNSNTTTTATSITTTTSSSNGSLYNYSTISNNDNHHYHDNININHLSTIQIEQLASRAEELSSEVAVLLSGGVDSSVALKLLIDEGMYVLMVIVIMMKDIWQR